jgi:EmrB/QacA subfamily drug resistance transporter
MAAVFNPCDAALGASATPCPNRHPLATLIATVLGSSLAFIDGSVMNVALPAISSDLQASPAELSWVINAYLLPSGALILLGGACGDHFGRRRFFIGGAALFLAASLVCAFAPSFALMVAGRLLQGIGAAFLMPNSLAILGSTFSGEAKGRAIGAWAGVGALSMAFGPLLGGWLVDAIGWRSIFLMNLPFGLAAICLAVAYVPESESTEAKRRLDWTGAALITAGLAVLSAVLSEGSASGFGLTALSGGAVSVLLLATFLVREVREGENALMPVFLVSTPSFAGLTLLTFLLYGALGGLIVLMPFLLISVLGFSAAGAGAALLPIPVLVATGSRYMGGIAGRIGGRVPLAGGALMVAIGLALFWRIATPPLSYWSDIFPEMVLIAVGMTLCVAPLTTTVMSSVDPRYVGVASGFNSAVSRIGGLLATALLGFVFVRQGDPSAFLESSRLAALLGALACFGASISAFLLIAPLQARDTDRSSLPMANCVHLEVIRTVIPRTLGCEECLATGSTWFHLRVCRTCGHVGCCDESPGKHATAHFRATSHPIIEGYDPPEGWGWCYVDEALLELGKNTTPQVGPIPRYY